MGKRQRIIFLQIEKRRKPKTQKEKQILIIGERNSLSKWAYMAHPVQPIVGCLKGRPTQLDLLFGELI